MSERTLRESTRQLRRCVTNTPRSKKGRKSKLPEEGTTTRPANNMADANPAGGVPAGEETRNDGDNENQVPAVEVDSQASLDLSQGSVNNPTKEDHDQRLKNIEEILIEMRKERAQEAKKTTASRSRSRSKAPSKDKDKGADRSKTTKRHTRSPATPTRRRSPSSRPSRSRRSETRRRSTPRRRARSSQSSTRPRTRSRSSRRSDSRRRRTSSRSTSRHGRHRRHRSRPDATTRPGAQNRNRPKHSMTSTQGWEHIKVKDYHVHVLLLSHIVICPQT